MLVLFLDNFLENISIEANDVKCIEKEYNPENRSIVKITLYDGTIHFVMGKVPHITRVINSSKGV